MPPSPTRGSPPRTPPQGTLVGGLKGQGEGAVCQDIYIRNRRQRYTTCREEMLFIGIQMEDQV